MLKFLLDLPQLYEELSVKEKLSAVSPIDGRYGGATAILRNFFSEAGLQRLRTFVEVEWLIFFCKLNSISLSEKEEKSLRKITTSFTLDDAVRIKKDELLTPDSSRFWPLAEYKPGRSQRSFDKQPVRDWLIESAWDKTPPGPKLPQKIIDETKNAYKEIYTRLTDKTI